MKKTLVSLIILPLLVSLSLPLFGVSTSEPFFWSESYASVALEVNLGDESTHPIPTGGWGTGATNYNTDKNMIGLIGANRVTAATTVTISGDFRFMSVSDPTKYRDFKLALIARSNNTDDTYAEAPGGEGVAAFAVGSTTQYLLGAENGASQTYSLTLKECGDDYPARWIDFVIVLEGTDDGNLGTYTDYMTNLTISLSSPDPAVEDRTMAFSMIGWYNGDSSVEPEFSHYFFSCVPTSLAHALRIRDYTSDSAQIATLKFQYNEKCTQTAPKFKIYINSNEFYSVEKGEKFKLVREGTTVQTKYNTTPYTVTATGAFWSDEEGTGATSMTFDGTDGPSKAGGACLYIPYSDSPNPVDGTTIRTSTLEAPLSVRFNATDVENLLAGQYTSTIYLYLVTY